MDIGSSYGYLTLTTNNTERMRIDSSGNVGIGMDNPVNKLDVAGNISASVITSSGLTTTTLLATPFSASGAAFTPVLYTGSTYLQVGAGSNYLFVYNGTRWTSASLA